MLEPLPPPRGLAPSCRESWIRHCSCYNYCAREAAVNERLLIPFRKVLLIQLNDLITKWTQECIQLESVPPASVAVSNRWTGVSASGVGVGFLPRGCLPLSPLECVLLGSRGVSPSGLGHSHPQTHSMYTTPAWTKWQAGVKTLPFRNFVCGRY